MELMPELVENALQNQRSKFVLVLLVFGVVFVLVGVSAYFVYRYFGIRSAVTPLVTIPKNSAIKVVSISVKGVIEKIEGNRVTVRDGQDTYMFVVSPTAEVYKAVHGGPRYAVSDIKVGWEVSAQLKFIGSDFVATFMTTP